MTFQTSVRMDMASGVVGELAYDSPSRVTPVFVNPENAVNAYIGRFYTVDPTTGKANPGGVIGTEDDAPIFGGIAIMPKEYTSYGNSKDGPLGASMLINVNQPASLCSMGMVWMYTTANVQAGMQVTYNTSTGVVGILSRGGTVPDGSALIPNTSVFRVPLKGTASGGMYVIKLTN